MKTKALLIDAGNTRVKWQIVQGQIGTSLIVLERGSETTLAWLDASKSPQAVGDLLSLAKVNEVETAWVSHVLGSEFAASLPSLLSPLKLKQAVQGNSNWLATRYQDPSSLGQDRWLNCLAVARLTTAPLNLIASFGTATTIDAVVQSEFFRDVTSPVPQPFVHLGGLIAPGVSTMLESLSVNGRQLPLAELDQTPWPTNTQSAIGSAVQCAQLQLVVERLRLLCEQFDGLAVKLWITGGYAQTLTWPERWPDALSPQMEYLPDGVLTGLKVAMESTE